jgi:hypothetical protein
MKEHPFLPEKILAINGSHHGVKGHTHAFLQAISKGVTAAGGEFETLTLAGLKIQRCLGCGLCHTVDHALCCALAERDDVAMVFEKMADADLIIFATPIQVFGISSLLKTLLDRLYSTSDVNRFRVTRSGLFFHDVDERICSKPFVALISCDNLDAEMPINARQYFRQYARFMDAPLAGELIRNAGGIVYQKDDPQILLRFPKIAQVFLAYEESGRELVTLGRIRRSTQQKANQEIIPVPFFGQLKRLSVLKHVMVEKAQGLLDFKVSEKG